MSESVYLAEHNNKPIMRLNMLARAEEDVWDAIKRFEAYGLENEYEYSKRELKKRGWGVGRYNLVRAS